VHLGGNILTLLSSHDNTQGVIQCAEIFSQVIGKGIQITHFGRQSSTYVPSRRPNAAGEPPHVLRDELKFRKPGMLVADWQNQCGAFKNVLQEAVTTNVPAAIVRRESRDKVRRILVPVIREEQSVHQLAVAHVMASALQAPVAISALVEPPVMANPAALANLRELLLARARMIGIAAETVAVEESLDAVSAVKDQFQNGDLVILATPNSWRYIENCGATVPALLMPEISDVLLYLPPKTRTCHLREVFEENICMPVAPRGKTGFASALIDALIQRGQVPLAWKSALASRMAEQGCGIEAGHCESLFWKVHWPGLSRLLGGMGVIKEGVPGVRFGFLFLVPDALHVEFLEIVAKLSRLIVMPGMRRELAACQSSADALSKLDLDSL